MMRAVGNKMPVQFSAIKFCTDIRSPQRTDFSINTTMKLTCLFVCCREFRYRYPWCQGDESSPKFSYSATGEIVI